MTDPWRLPGRDLDVIPVPPGRWQRIVALLNVWEDRPELEANIATWLPHVDAVIAADGAYRDVRVPTPHSTDGTIEFLRETCGDKLTLIRSPDDFWPDQNVKRTALYRAGREGDLLWRIDADEHIENGAAVRKTPDLDVGWATYEAPIYRRTQGIPVLFRWRPGLEIRDRHHYTYDGPRLVCTHQIAGSGYVHRVVPIHFTNRKTGNRPAGRMSKALAHRKLHQRIAERQASPAPQAGIEPLVILNAASIDPGLVAYRLHTAINTSGPHCSVFVLKSEDWRQGPFQMKLDRAFGKVNEADVLHCHVSPTVGNRLIRAASRPPLVMHHHGTMYRRSPEAWNQGDANRRAVLRLVSNLELLQYDPGKLAWLPNPVPVARYRQLAAPIAGTFRIAHSPTKPEFKGTAAFLRACERVKARGVPVEPVLIGRKTHAQTLATKATCHATFDSFWLGLQCAGLEGAAMGHAVIAGDPDCRREYTARYGSVPYTYANDEGELAEAIERLTTDPAYYESEAARVGAYTLEHHDYAAVVARYLDMLDRAIGWRASRRIGVRARAG
jgi:glycosyltransferase involved in cell wall biosynthesis